ncbi:MAG TPA: DUF1318 domain-containing protein [Polyangiaceae bacterium]|nr:DUF1318 domain-containing protein [Polyangiaceae bacterium]
MMRRVLLFVGAVAAVGCIKPPEIVMVDRATALEQQAGGSFPALEKKLAQAAIAPRPVPLTPDQLETLGMGSARLIDQTEMTDADRVDDLLQRHCVGEGRNGLLADTANVCRGAVERDEVVKLVDRVNLARTQLWRWMHEQRPELSLEEVRSRWRKTHASGVVCGGWMEGDDGKWEAKSC